MRTKHRQDLDPGNSDQFDRRPDCRRPGRHRRRFHRRHMHCRQDPIPRPGAWRRRADRSSGPAETQPPRPCAPPRVRHRPCQEPGACRRTSIGRLWPIPPSPRRSGMPKHTLARLVTAAVASGLDPQTPAPAMANATRSDEFTLAAPIAALPDHLAGQMPEGPMPVPIGRVLGEPGRAGGGPGLRGGAAGTARALAGIEPARTQTRPARARNGAMPVVPARAAATRPKPFRQSILESGKAHPDCYRANLCSASGCGPGDDLVDRVGRTLAHGLFLQGLRASFRPLADFHPEDPLPGQPRGGWLQSHRASLRRQ